MYRETKPLRCERDSNRSVPVLYRGALGTEHSDKHRKVFYVGHDDALRDYRSEN